MKAKFYLGRKGTSRIVFKSVMIPTFASHGHLYDSVMGPFRTKRGAISEIMTGLLNQTPSLNLTREQASKLALQQMERKPICPTCGLAKGHLYGKGCSLPNSYAESRD